jgi:LysM repeat protein
MIVCKRVNRRFRPIHLLKSAVLPAASWLLVCAVLASGSALAADDSYTVKRGDTLHGIAQRHGIPPAVLAERNGLSRNAYVYTGQRLTIPARFTARRPGSTDDAAAQNIVRRALPRSIQRAIDRAPVRPGRWQYIVVHHSDVDRGTVKGMDAYHRQVRHMENGLAYHFVIGNGSGMGDGEIAVSRRWTQQLDGGHLASEAQNKVAIGICLVGDFDKQQPTAREMESLRALVEALMARCQLTSRAVKTHQQINIVPTRCPGSKFPTRTFLNSLQSPAR